MNHEGMKFSLVSRELIANSIEAIVHGLAYDGLVGFGGCDKTLPGVMMGMVRCNVPSVFMYGGAALPGRFGGRDVTILNSYEAVGAVLAGAMDEATLAQLERSCLPTVGACAGQFTANTMAMVSEALGLSVPNVSMVPGPYAERAGFARRAGAIVMRAVANGGPRPRDIVTRKALENACAVVAATGGSTNSALHIPAIAHEAGIAFDLDDVAAVLARTPLIADLRPGGRFTARDVHEIGGTAVIIRALIETGAIDGSCLAATGETLAQTYGDAPPPDGAVVRVAGAPIAPDGGVAVLKGNLCPDGALIKLAGLRTLVHEGPARVFESEGDCARAVGARAYKAGDVLVIRNEGPVGGRHAGDARSDGADLWPADGRGGRARDRRAVSGATRGICVGHVAPEAAVAPLALVRDGDIVRIDAAGRCMDLRLDAAEIAARRAVWRPLAPRHKAGLLAKYAAQVGQANKGAVTHAGGADWPWFDR